MCGYVHGGCAPRGPHSRGVGSLRFSCILIPFARINHHQTVTYKALFSMQIYEWRLYTNNCINFLQLLNANLAGGNLADWVISCSLTSCQRFHFLCPLWVNEVDGGGELGAVGTVYSASVLSSAWPHLHGRRRLAPEQWGVFLTAHRE